MFTRKKTFDIANIPKISLVTGIPVAIDIGYLGNEDHTSAFVAIFEKMVNDSWSLLSTFDRIEVEAKHPVGPLAMSLSQSGGVNLLKERVQEIARELYFTNNDKVSLWFCRSSEKKRLFVVFDNPYFVFDAH